MKYALAALLALVFCLAACAGEGAKKHVQLPAHLLDHPTAILCAAQEPVQAGGAAGNKQQPSRIEVPSGKNPTDLCSAIIERYYNIAPGVAYSAPMAPDGSPPPAGRLPNNKTPGQPP